MSVDEPGNDGLAGDVDALGARGHVDGVGGADGFDATVADDDDGVGDNVASRAVEDGGADERLAAVGRGRLLGGRSKGEAKQYGENGGP